MLTCFNFIDMYMDYNHSVILIRCMSPDLFLHLKSQHIACQLIKDRPSGRLFDFTERKCCNGKTIFPRERIAGQVKKTSYLLSTLHAKLVTEQISEFLILIF
jgi:hypothetical protein